ncbi:MAG TPA: hypothetical protein VFW75_15485 [Acetobacteraceae bacterium]|nr:hypothetical protein [Acetobacteraceae bacterium]
MKKNEQPEFSARWWKGSQPKGLKSAGKLEDALRNYELAKKKLEQGGDANAVKAATGALDAIEPAADAVIAEASKDKKDPEMGFTVDALKKFARACAAEEAWIEEQAEQDDDSVFADPEAYHDYLIAAMKKLRSGSEMNFGFVLGKKAEEHRLAVHRSKGSKALANILVKETGFHAMTFGTAVADDNRADVLLLVLEGRQLPGMKKKGERMLKKFKPLPFKKLAVIVDGEEVEDVDDPDDSDVDEPDDEIGEPASATSTTSTTPEAAETTAAPAASATPEAAEAPDLSELTRELADLIRQVQGVGDPVARGGLAQVATEANAALKGGDQPQVISAMATLREGLETARNGLGGNGQDAGGRTGNGGNGKAKVYAKSRAAWVATRQKIETDIGKLHDEMSSVYQDHGVAEDLEKAFQTHVERMLTSLDASLAEKLDEMNDARDPAQHAQLVAEAQQIIKRYGDYVSSEPIIAAIDTNPFVPMAIQRTVTTTLGVLSKALA